MDNPWELLGTSFRSSLTLDAKLPASAMPNHYRSVHTRGCNMQHVDCMKEPDAVRSGLRVHRFAAKAGSALLFDTGVW